MIVDWEKAPVGWREKKMRKGTWKRNRGDWPLGEEMSEGSSGVVGYMGNETNALKRIPVDQGWIQHLRRKEVEPLCRWIPGGRGRELHRRMMRTNFGKGAKWKWGHKNRRHHMLNERKLLR